MNQRVPFQMQQDYFDHAHGMHGGGYGFGWAIFALLLLLVLILFAQLMLTMRRPRFAGQRMWGRGHRHGAPPWQEGASWNAPDPAAVARMRYARGEIARDEYVQLVQDLGGEPGPAPEAPPPPA